jgi:hypothetical protein
MARRIVHVRIGRFDGLIIDCPSIVHRDHPVASIPAPWVTERVSGTGTTATQGILGFAV